MSSEFPPPNPSSDEPSSGDLPPPPPGPPNWPPPPPPPPGGFDGGYPPPGGGYPPPGGYGPTTNQKAIVSLVTGIAGIVCCGPLGIAAIIFGIMARKEINQSGRIQTGSGLALAGIILGVLALAWTVLALLLISTGSINTDFTTS